VPLLLLVLPLVPEQTARKSRIKDTKQCAFTDRDITVAERWDGQFCAVFVAVMLRLLLLLRLPPRNDLTSSQYGIRSTLLCFCSCSLAVCIGLLQPEAETGARPPRTHRQQHTDSHKLTPPSRSHPHFLFPFNVVDFLSCSPQLTSIILYAISIHCHVHQSWFGEFRPGSGLRRDSRSSCQAPAACEWTAAEPARRCACCS
jgi:hypothetical protein